VDFGREVNISYFQLWEEKKKAEGYYEWRGERGGGHERRWIGWGL